MNQKNYNMTFSEVLEELFDTENTYSNEKAWFQGNDFRDGVFIRLSNSTQLGIINIFKFEDNRAAEIDLGPMQVNRGVYTQMYRRVYTRDDILRKKKECDCDENDRQV